MIEGIVELISGFGELLFLLTGIYSFYRFFTLNEVDSLILSIFSFTLFIFGVVYWIIKKESFFTQYV